MLKNIGGAFNYIGDKINYLYKMATRFICDCINLILLNSTGDDLINYQIYGNSEQDGTPTPAVPVAVESVGDLVTDSTDEHYGKYKIPVITRGKNLFDDNRSVEYKGENACNGCGRITNEKIANGYKIINKYSSIAFELNLKKKTYYTISFDYETNTTNAKIGFCRDDYNGSTVADKLNHQINLENGRVYYTFKSAVDSSNNRLGFSTYFDESASAVYYISIQNIQLEEGSTATAYEPYIEPVTTNIYLTAPLRKINDVADYIDYIGSKVVRGIDKVVYNGTEIWARNNNFSDIYVYNVAKPSGLQINETDLLCNYTNNFGTNPSSYANGLTVGGNLNITVAGITTVEEFIGMLVNSNMEVYYPIATPTEETVTLPPISTVEGTTVIEVDTTIDPSNMYVQYYSSEE